jgi:hypothetical protein
LDLINGLDFNHGQRLVGISRATASANSITAMA